MAVAQRGYRAKEISGAADHSSHKYGHVLLRSPADL
jgi:hypothetical protein